MVHLRCSVKPVGHELVDVSFQEVREGAVAAGSLLLSNDAWNIMHVALLGCFNLEVSDDVLPTAYGIGRPCLNGTWGLYHGPFQSLSEALLTTPLRDDAAILELPDCKVVRIAEKRKWIEPKPL
jgi:hypothetical protein